MILFIIGTAITFALIAHWIIQSIKDNRNEKEIEKC